MMKRIHTFESFLNAYEQPIDEAKGVSRAIAGHLKSFFDEEGKNASYDKACEYIASKVEGWKLSKEDFEEAKGMMNESEILTEGKMKELDMIMKSAESAADFKTDAEKFLKSNFKGTEDEMMSYLEELVAQWEANHKK
jgi:hypothetical protein